jgi:hypothetical protein
METKNDNKYITGKIYSIRSYQTDNIYIGSTVIPLHKRFHKHRSLFKHFEEGKKYLTSFEILKFDDNYIELLEEYPCENKMQLNRKEGELIRKFKSIAVNVRVEGQTKKEYQEQPEIKEKRKDYNVEYRVKNKDAIADKKKIYHEVNREKILEKHSEYYYKTKEALSEKYTCECGSEIQKGQKRFHVKTKKHQKYLSSIVA